VTARQGLATPRSLLAGVHYCRRSDEIDYDPVDRVILIANPSPLSTATGHGHVAPYATFIEAQHPYRVLGHIAFAGGLEQPRWDPEMHRFLLSVPGSVTSGVVTTPPSLVVIDPIRLKVDKTYTFDCNALAGTLSADLTGVALGSAQRALVSACGDPIIVDARTGNVIKVITQVGGGDEVWYNPGDRRFYVTGVSTLVPAVQSLGVIDPDRAMWLENVSDLRGKNAAALAENNAIVTIVTITAVAATPSTDNSICAAVAVLGTGCVAVFAHTEPATGAD
jgi:hypothetical protein